MQVSNSTGRNTGYRIGSSGGSGAASLAIELHDGTTYSRGMVSGALMPGGSELVHGGYACAVEFLVGGFLVARASFPEDPGTVTLVERDGEFAIESNFAAA
jgi:hypothetical protein